MKINKGRGYVYSIQYHIVWCTKYRRKVIHGSFENRLKEMLHHIAKENGFKIVEMECNEDHIHLLVDCSPQIFIPNMIKAMKGNTGRFLFKEFPEVKQKLWGGHLRNPSYFIATVSENTAEQARDYIHSQKQR